MIVRLVTTWETACGIAAHSEALVDAVTAADPTIRFSIEQTLHPDGVLEDGSPAADLVVLNYHAALHSQWTPAAIVAVQRERVPVVVIYHDTGVPNSDQCRGIQAIANATVVHEPCEDLPGAIYWRQGVPGAQRARQFGVRAPEEFSSCFKAYDEQPVLGSVGFPFPWKNYPLLAEATSRAGWALLLLAPGMSEAEVAALTTRNPDTLVVPSFIPAEAVVAYLSGCDATAFLYTCANTGTSGAIRQGLAARKPVLASHPSVCRQFRDLEGEDAIRWLTDLSPDGVARALAAVPIQRIDPGIVALAARDSWTTLGQRYAALFRAFAAIAGGQRV